MAIANWWDVEDKAGLAAWIKTRPPEVQAVFAEFPVGTRIDMPTGETLIVFGVTQTVTGADMLIAFPADSADYDEAMYRKKHICVHHLRAGEAHYVTVDDGNH